MSTTVYFTSLGLIFGTILAVFAMRYYAMTQKAKAETKAAGDQSAVEASLAAIAARLTAIEKILKDVE